MPPVAHPGHVEQDPAGLVRGSTPAPTVHVHHLGDLVLDDEPGTLAVGKVIDVERRPAHVRRALVEDGVDFRGHDERPLRAQQVASGIGAGPGEGVVVAAQRKTVVADADHAPLRIDYTRADLRLRILRPLRGEERHRHEVVVPSDHPLFASESVAAARPRQCGGAAPQRPAEAPQESVRFRCHRSPEVQFDPSRRGSQLPAAHARHVEQDPARLEYFLVVVLVVEVHDLGNTALDDDFGARAARKQGDEYRRPFHVGRSLVGDGVGLGVADEGVLRRQWVTPASGPRPGEEVVVAAPWEPVVARSGDSPPRIDYARAHLRAGILRPKARQVGDRHEVVVPSDDSDASEAVAEVGDTGSGRHAGIGRRWGRPRRRRHNHQSVRGNVRAAGYVGRKFWRRSRQLCRSAGGSHTNENYCRHSCRQQYVWSI
mmetsp:Transcript_3838/g.8054  ORF Transcript_3838/g.8054 Transcript_3838/m.8054 type:complete len:429 (+) Transcript_3838:504-1790(+)